MNFPETIKQAGTLLDIVLILKAAPIMLISKPAIYLVSAQKLKIYNKMASKKILFSLFIIVPGLILISSALANKPSFEVAPQAPPKITNISIESQNNFITITANVKDPVGVAYARAIIKDPNNNQVGVQLLYDDGSHNDQAAGDNIFGNKFDMGLYAPDYYTIDIETSDYLGYTTTKTNVGTFSSSAPAPVITNITSSDITAAQANITWITNEPANSQVEYGLTAAYGFSSPLDTGMTTNHKVSLNRLSQNTLYHYRVKSTNDSGIQAVSPDYTFTTAPTAKVVSYRVPNITVNGELSESFWNDLLNNNVDKAVIGTVAGASDNSAVFGSVYDDNNLYIGVKVLDDALFSDSVNNWDDDSIEFYFDGQHTHGTGLQKFLKQGSPNTKTIAGGYTAEYSIPWSDLGFTPPAPTLKTIDVQVTQRLDDTTVDNGVNKNGNYPLITETSPVRNSGIRFQNIAIPQGSTINAAYIELKIHTGTADDIDINIYGEAADNAANFIDTNTLVNNRSKTSAFVTWTQLNAGIGYKQSPDISALIQEIVQRPGWSSGNNLSILMFGRSDSKMEAFSCDYAIDTYGYPDCTAQAARLHVEYTPPALPTAPPVGTILGFDLGVNDDDNGSARESQLMWNGDSNNWENALNFGHLEIGGEICGISDVDGDGYASITCGGTDCNDNNAAINPGAAEICGNGIDDNCNDSIDEGCIQPFNMTITNVSMPASVQKNQSFNIDITVNVSGDKEANYRGIFVKATDNVSGICQRVGSSQTGCSTSNYDPFWNGTKTYTINFPGLSTEGTHILTIEAIVDVSLAPDEVKDTKTNNLEVAAAVCLDNDGDNYLDITCGGTDCNDGNAAINPGAAEICGNGIDDNCNGSIDEGCSLVNTADHPYLFFTDADLTSMRSDAANPASERKAIYDSLKSLIDTQGRADAKDLSAVALVYLISQDIKYGDWVKNTMWSMAGWNPDWGTGSGEKDLVKGDYIFNFAIAYDLLYDYLSANERTTFRNTLARELDYLYQDSLLDDCPDPDNCNWWGNDYIQNHLHHAISALGIGSLAIISEGNQITNGYNQSNVDAWLATSKDKIAKAMFLMSNMEGGWHEGWSYQRFMTERFPEFIYALRRVDGTDHFSNNNGFRKYADFALYNARPDNSEQHFMTFGDWGADEWINPLDAMRLIAREYRNGYAQWLADKYAADFGRTPGAGNNNYVPITDHKKFAFEFIFYDSSVPSTPPAGLPLYYDENDLGLSIMKSNWDINDLVLGLKSGYYGGEFAFNQVKSNWCWDPAVCGGTTYWVGGGDYPQDHELNVAHNHPDQNGLYLFGNGQWLFPETPGYDLAHGDDWGKLTKAHNTILIDGRGQISEDNRAYRGPGPDSWLKDYKDFWKHSSSIIEKSHTQNYDYVVGDATNAYPEYLGLTEFKRNVMFLKSNYLVVFDKLNANSAKTYGWRGHALDGVLQEGNWIKGISKNNQLLGIYVLSPNGYSYSSGDETANLVANSSTYYTITYFDPDRQIYYFELTKSATDVRFITVLYPTDVANWNSKPVITLLGEDSQRAGIKVKFSDNSEDYILSTYGVITDVTVGNFSYNGKAATIRKNSTGELKSIFLSRGTYLQELGADILRTSNNNIVFDAVYSGNTVTVSGENITDFTLYAPGITSLIVNGASANFTRNGDYISYSGTTALLDYINSEPIKTYNIFAAIADAFKSLLK
jgi:hypothetical protein